MLFLLLLLLLLLLLGGTEAVEQAKLAVSKGLSGTHGRQPAAVFGDSTRQGASITGFEAFQLPYYSFPRTTRHRVGERVAN